MPRKRYAPDQIISKLREAEVLLSQGQTVSQTSKQLGVSDQAYYRWRKEFGGMLNSQVCKFKDLENENARLKKLVADLSLDNAPYRCIIQRKLLLSMRTKPVPFAVFDKMISHPNWRLITDGMVHSSNK